jgi:type II secretory pathway pseudopilin PulG
LLIVIAIACTLAAIAIPQFLNAMNTYRLSAAVSATTGALQSTRFQAIMHGCQYQLVITSATLSYQVYSETPALGSGTTGCLGAFAPVPPGTPIPIASGYITMSGTSFTYTFYPNGTVTMTSSPANTTLEISNRWQKHPSTIQNYIYVSGVGNVSTCQPTSTCVCSATNLCQ